MRNILNADYGVVLIPHSALPIPHSERSALCNLMSIANTDFSPSSLSPYGK